MFNRNLNGSNLEFPQDKLLSFKEATHTYTVEGVGMVTPVSSVIKFFFKEFDAVGISRRKCGGNEDEAAKLRDQWEAKGYEASLAGTHLHKQIEENINGIPEPLLECDVDYAGPFVSVQKTIDIRKEWEFYKNFRKDIQVHPFRTEWAVFDVDAKMAGTIDLLAAKDEGTYEIFDWKRSNKIAPGMTNRWAHGQKGLEHLPDTTYIHYCLQQNLYCYMLEKNYGLSISGMNLVVLHPDYNNYRLIKLPRMDMEVKAIVKYLKK